MIRRLYKPLTIHMYTRLRNVLVFIHCKHSITDLT